MISIRRIILCVCFVIIITGTASWGLSQQINASESRIPFAEKAATETDSDPIKISAYLYFADQAYAFLTAEKRDLMVRGDSISLARAVIKALIHGPETDLVPILPPETVLRAIYIGQDKTAYIDLDNSVRNRLTGGIQSELFTIYAMVNSLVLNISAIEKVKILVQGREAETLAGHIDLSLPFKANMRMIR